MVRRRNRKENQEFEACLIPKGYSMFNVCLPLDELSAVFAQQTEEDSTSNKLALRL
jgi:hypothetical protein